jgi:superfamily II DNA or RNA helicase
LRVSGWIILGSIKKMYRWVDIHQVDSVVIASPIKFESTVIQAVGRCLRKCETKWAIWVHIFNDSILSGQRYEQTKVIRKEYNLEPNVIYIQKDTSWKNASVALPIS